MDEPAIAPSIASGYQLTGLQSKGAAGL